MDYRTYISRTDLGRQVSKEGLCCFLCTCVRGVGEGGAYVEGCVGECGE